MIDNIFKDFEQYIPSNFKVPTTPMSSDRKMDEIADGPQSEEERLLMKKLPFRSFLARLMQVTTHYEVKLALNLISKSQCNPGFANWIDLIRVLVFMNVNKGKKLKLEKKW